MGLFGFGKKKDEKTGCCCGDSYNENSMEKAKDAINSGESVKVLGSGCAKFSLIAAYGVMTTPALVVDGKVVSYGKVLNKEEAVSILKKVRG